MVFTKNFETFAEAYRKQSARNFWIDSAKYQNFSPLSPDDLISSAPPGTFDDAEYESCHEGCDIRKGGDLPLPDRYITRRDKWCILNNHKTYSKTNNKCLIAHEFSESEIFGIAREVGAQLVVCTHGKIIHEGQRVKTYYFKCKKGTNNPRGGLPWTPETIRKELSPTGTIASYVLYY